jgi:hypothetical protein
LNTSGQKKEISILLPVHNEALQIEKCIQEVGAAVSRLSDSYEIIVSEDGSTDGTDAIVSTLLLTDPNLSLLHSNARLGKGRAIKKALERARGDIVVFMDADLATSLDYLPKVLQSVRERDGLAIASRHVEGSVVRRRASRTFFSLAYNVTVRLLFLDSIRDHQCGFKAMSRKASRAVLDTKSNGFFFDTEMILRCKRQGFSIVEIGVEWAETRGKGESKVKLFRDAKRIGLDLLAFRLSP